MDALGASHNAFRLVTLLSQTEPDLTVLTPVKKVKGQTYLDAADRLWSTAVNCVRQPLESRFNWLEEKTGIQRASKVRSANGLLIQVVGHLATALWLLPERQSV